jgi:hypothetical protein
MPFTAAAREWVIPQAARLLVSLLSVTALARGQKSEAANRDRPAFPAALVRRGTRRLLCRA